MAEIWQNAIMQRGHIFKYRKSWFLKYYDVHLANGQRAGRRACKKLADVNETYRTKADVRTLADKILAPINSGIITPESSMQVSDFIENHYLPHVKATLRASTYKDYGDVWRCHVNERLGKVTLRDFRTVHGQRLIQGIDGIGHTSLLRVKSFLSGVFTYCKQEGILDGVNPMQGVKVRGRATKAKMPVYSIEEIETAIYALQEPARTIFAVAAFSGLRLSELRGLRWSDYDGNSLQVSRSVWRTHVSAPKTAESEAAVPVLPILARALEGHKKRCKNPTSDSYIFAGERFGAPLNLANLARRVIKPNIESCSKCKKARAKHNKEDHTFELDASLVWKGWHALRRGLATNLDALGIRPRVIQSILRHASMATTMDIYVKSESADARAAVTKLEGAFGGMDDYFWLTQDSGE
jgi:integrase